MRENWLMYCNLMVYFKSVYLNVLINTMHINSEPLDKYSIHSYSENSVVIGDQTYQHSLIVTATKLISDWPIKDFSQLNKTMLASLIAVQPKIIIIGHKGPHQKLEEPLLQQMHALQIGFELMQLGPACRTFNILLHEQREVVLGLIFPE